MTRVAQLCGYGCGRMWTPWAGTKLIGHAACAGEPELHDDVMELMDRFPAATIDRVAADLHVSVGVLRSWLRIARERRSRRRKALQRR